MDQLIKTIEVKKINHLDRKFFNGPGLPLEDLYYWGNGNNPENAYQISFAGDNLCYSLELVDIQEITAMFYGEKVDDRSRESWADPIRAEILRRLAGTTRQWYIGFRSCWPLAIYDEYSKILLDMHITRLPMWEFSEIAIVDSGYRVGFGKGIVKKPILDVKNELLTDFVPEVWGSASPAFSIEGYCLEIGKLSLFRSWNEQPRTSALFKQVLDECLMLFFTFGNEPRHFHFITNKMDTEEMKQVIDLTDLEERARLY